MKMPLSNLEIEQLKYPIGNFKAPDTYSMDNHKTRIESIRNLPHALEAALKPLSKEQVDTPYRPEGWTVRQLIHHIADSHINAFTRFKLGLTEDNPTIRPYDQGAWCSMKDANDLDPSVSMKIIEGLHERWSYVLDNMTASDFERNIFHPEMNKSLHLGTMLALYSWHSNHHLAHVNKLKERMAWD